MSFQRPSYLFDLLFAVLPRAVVRSTALIPQTLHRPIPSLPPFRHCLPTRLIPYCRFRCPMLNSILHHSLTMIRFLCYPVHAENPFRGLFLLQLQFTTLRFSVPFSPCYLCIIPQQKCLSSRANA